MDTAINIILFLLLLFFLARKFIPVNGIRNINTVQLKEELRAKGKQFVDVRTPAEFKGNHIPGFENMPLYQLQQKAAKLSKEKEIVVICQSGMRSKQATRILKKMGFTSITNVVGGMSAWR